MNIEKKVELKIKETIKKYKLISRNDRVLVALSGGKDSASVAHVLKKLKYEVEGIHIDLKIGGKNGYSERCLEAVKKLSSDLKIKLHVYDIKKETGSSMCYLRTAIQASNEKNKKGKLKNCAICGVIKKWVLNREARKIRGITKIATGHNLDDECQTFLANILKGSPGLSANSGPITRNAENKKFIPRIKPLFFVLENDVMAYSKKIKLPVVYEKCPCALDSYRIQLRKFLEKIPAKKKENLVNNFEKLFPLIEKTKDSRMKFCELCGEPSRNRICKRCELMKSYE